jgi:hypothetical protein
MKYAVEMVSRAMAYIPGFIKIGSGVQKLIDGIHRQHGDRIRLFLFFLNKKSRVKRYNCPCAYLIERYAMKTYGGVEVYFHHS